MVPKRVIFGLFFALFWLIIFLNITGGKTSRLYGDYSLPGKPEYTKQAFFDATYQDALAEYIRTNNPIYTELIRINNQYRYSLFNVMPPGGSVVGKNGVLFDKGRINSFYGEGSMSEFDWNYYMNLFVFVSDTLHKLNKPIVYVNVGDKARIMEDYIPDNLRRPATDTTTYALYKRKLKNDNRLTFIDMAAYFMAIKDTSKIELYPPYSIHWSMYSTYLATDSVAKTVNKLLPAYESAVPYLKGFEVSTKARGIEYDLLDLMNIHFGKPKSENHYPILNFTKKTTKKKPRLFIVGDSFGQMMNDFNYIHQAFDANSVFLRYNAQYKRSATDELENIHTNFNYWDEFAKADAIVFVSSELNLNNFGLGFFENAYSHFKGIDDFVECYHTQNVVRTEEAGHYVYSIKKGTPKFLLFSNRNPNVKAGKTYKLTYWEKGVGEMTMDFYPDNLPGHTEKYANTDWKQYTWQFTMPEDNMPQVALWRMYLETKETVENDMWFKQFKLEEVK